MGVSVDCVPGFGSLGHRKREVLVVEAHRCHDGAVIHKVEDVELVDALLLDVVVLPDLEVDPLEAGGLSH